MTPWSDGTGCERTSDSLGPDVLVCCCDQRHKGKVQGLGMCRRTVNQQPQRAPKTQEVMCSTSVASQAAGSQEEGRSSFERKLVSRGELRRHLSSWQRNNLWGLTQCHAQMGFNECGDDNDDNYSNSSLSPRPREVSAVFVICLNLRGDPPS